jgi:hypothetical protein
MGEVGLGSLRVGTWNMGRSGAFHRTRISRQLQVLAQCQADLWILTDAHAANVPAEGYACSSAPDVALHQEGEHRVILWSRFPLMAVSTEDPVSTVAARLEPPELAQPLLVYGSAITHTQAGMAQRQRLSWQRRQDAVQRQRAEWLRLSREYPDHALCVAGDFGVNLSTLATYGAADARQGLLLGLGDAAMRCLSTDELRSPVEQDSKGCGVDHVCFSELQGLQGRVQPWPATEDGSRVSDRSGILVEIVWPRSSAGNALPL